MVMSKKTKVIGGLLVSLSLLLVIVAAGAWFLRDRFVIAMMHREIERRPAPAKLPPRRREEVHDLLPRQEYACPLVRTARVPAMTSRSVATIRLQALVEGTGLSSPAYRVPSGGQQTSTGYPRNRHENAVSS